MISDKVLGVYAAVGSLDPVKQAEWYDIAAKEWNINTFEIPLLGGVPMATELAKTFSENASSLVVTLVAQWATKGQGNVNYGLSSLDEISRREAVLDVQSVIQQCLALSRQGVIIRTMELHTGQRVGSTISHAISFCRSLFEISEAAGVALPDCELSVEITDSLRPDHPIGFPGAKKASLKLSDLMETVAAVNNVRSGSRPISLVVNWGRLLINGDQPLSVVRQIIDSDVHLGGVILSGANPTADGFADAHNSHLDSGSGFSVADGQACAEALLKASEPSFIGMKCSVTTSEGELTPEQVLNAEADFLNNL